VGYLAYVLHGRRVWIGGLSLSLLCACVTNRPTWITNQGGSIKGCMHIAMHASTLRHLQAYLHPLHSPMWVRFMTAFAPRMLAMQTMLPRVAPAQHAASSRA
jgi:hypothetical protein